MGTAYQVIYDAFLSKVLDDEWAHWEWEEVQTDLRELLEGAIPQFKFSRISLERDENGFKEELTNNEIQILATWMKCEWLNRTIMTWENIKPLYDERDFSQANLLSKFMDALKAEQYNAEKLERKYYRSINQKPFDYTRLAGNVK